MAELAQQARFVRHCPIFHDLARLDLYDASRSWSCAGAVGAGAGP
jgi:hypothetical protein